jgi:hypothetical protein
MAYESEAVASLEWLRDQASLIGSRRTFSDSQADYKKVLGDPVLELPDVKAYLYGVFGDDWEEQCAPTQNDFGRLQDAFATKAPPRENMKLDVEVGMQATVTPMVLSDPKQVYAIQYVGMKEGLKSTNYTVETYLNGTLKSINVVLDDQTGTIVQSTLQSAAKIAAAAIGLPISFVEQAAPTGPVASFADWLKSRQSLYSPLCSAATRLKLAQKDALVAANEASAKKNLDLTKSMTHQEKVVADLAKAVDDNKKKLEAMAENDKGRDALTAVVKTATEEANAAQKKLDELKKSQQAIAEASSKLSDQLSKARKQLTLTTVTNFSPEAAIWRDNMVEQQAVVSIELGGAKEALEAWMDKNWVSNYCRKDKELCANGWPGNSAEALFAQAALNPPFTELVSVPPPPLGNVVYRQPVRALLFVCKKNSCLDNAGKLQAQQEDILLSSAVDVPQLGVLAALPLKNTAFQNNTLTASFAETGALTKLSYVTNASAAAAADTFTKSADIYLQYKDAKRTAEKSKLDQAKAQVDANTELLKSQLEEEKAKADLSNFLKGNANTSTTGASDGTP